MNFRTWKIYRRLRETDEVKALPNEVENSEGGYEPRNDEEVGRYKHADLITLPSGVEGTNCGNCRFLALSGHGGNTCDHVDLKGLPVSARMCCKYWDHAEVKRAWGDRPEDDCGGTEVQVDDQEADSEDGPAERC